MDIFEAMQAENRILEKEAKTLVDTTSSEPQIRQEQAARIKARFEAIESTRVKYIYPVLRNSTDGPPMADEYQERIDVIRSEIEQLQSTPADSRESYQRHCELLQKEITDLIHWELNDAHPASKKIMGDDTVVEIGEQIRAEEEEVFHQLLSQS